MTIRSFICTVSAALALLVLPGLCHRARAGETPDASGIYGSSSLPSGIYNGGWEKAIGGTEPVITPGQTLDTGTTPPTAVPEPATWLLLFTGASAVALRSRSFLPRRPTGR
jgi:hypothetical protein